MSLFDKSTHPESNCFSSCSTPPESAFDAGFNHRQDDTKTATNLKRRKQDMDELLSEAMNALTFEERKEQEDTLHGVAKDIAEEASFIDNALKELESHLVKQKAGAVYKTAETMSADHVSHRAFRIMFLRANRYDTKAAANQMLKFFEMKQRLFGNEKLVKDITIDDLDEDDRACLRSGWTQLCGRDRSGRMVFVLLPCVRKMKTLRSELRARYFIIMTALKSEQTQLRGAVWILYVVGELRNFQNNPTGYEELAEVSLRCPMYPAAIHSVTDDLREYFVCHAVTRVMPIKLRARNRIHFGSHLECQYRLSTYGIPRDVLPLTLNTRSISFEKHLQWYQSCLTVKTNGAAVVIQPTDKDVLYMGGTTSYNHGNYHLRNLVAEWSQTYDSGTKAVKSRVVKEIVDTIHRSGGRFLSKANDAKSVWVTVPAEEVRLKMTQMFRNRRRHVRGIRKKKNK